MTAEQIQQIKEKYKNGYFEKICEFYVGEKTGSRKYDK